MPTAFESGPSLLLVYYHRRAGQHALANPPPAWHVVYLTGAFVWALWAGLATSEVTTDHCRALWPSLFLHFRRSTESGGTALDLSPHDGGPPTNNSCGGGTASIDGTRWVCMPLFTRVSVTIVRPCVGHSNTRRVAGLMHRLLLGSDCSRSHSALSPSLPPYITLCSARSLI